MSTTAKPAYLLHTKEHGFVEITEAQAEKLHQAGGYKFEEKVMGSSVNGMIFITKQP